MSIQVQDPQARHSTAGLETGGPIDLAELRQKIEHAAHYLPAQGPINVFIHHNTLHAFEELSFHEGVVQGSQVFGGEPYLSESDFFRELNRGRIRDADLVAIANDCFTDDGNEKVLFESRRDFRLALLRYPVYEASAAELKWFMAESEALHHYRNDAPSHLRDRFIQETQHWILRDVQRRLPDGESTKNHPLDVVRHLIKQFGAKDLETWSEKKWESFGLSLLWQICRRGVAGLAVEEPVPNSVRHRDLLMAATRKDSDALVHEILIRFCGVFLDQGLAPWCLPNRERGFFEAFSALYGQSGTETAVWRQGLAAELLRIRTANLTPLESISESLTLLGIQPDEMDVFITSTLLVLRGFAGMLWQVETRGDRVPHPLPTDCLVEFLAVRLMLDRLAIGFIANNYLGYAEPLSQLRESLHSNATRSAAIDEQSIFQVFYAAQVLGWLPSDLISITREDWRRVAHEFKNFSSIERRRVFHLAYERRHRVTSLDAIAVFRPEAKPKSTPRFQVICCIDEREESFRRHLEEIANDVETFGVAGFFGVAIYYKGAADAHFTPLCPAVMQPTHWIIEEVGEDSQSSHRRLTSFRRMIGDISHRMHVSSRTFSLGALMSGSVGVFASIPLVARVLFPRITSRLRHSTSQLFHSPNTFLRMERTAERPSDCPEGIGYTVEEMCNVSERMLRDIGLTSNFAQLVFVVGHGSTSMNNPHESAHDCGACGGGRGGANARAMARMLNDPRIRTVLANRGIVIPSETAFIGCMHNTCDDAMTYYDLSALPSPHRDEFLSCQKNLESACERNAHERSRRFESASLTLSTNAARRHVEERSQDLSQVRPEYGHATNAVCLVGRRQRTRGLFMDRRTFLVSYDPLQEDANLSILSRILGAVIPVCGGISLEYYFSFIDPTGWGCGTKLPHNITSLLGVMDGAASDLRTGLPWQMVEVHEPVRILFVVETSPENLLTIMSKNPTISRMCRKMWIQIAALDPASSRIQVFDGSAFQEYEPQSTTLPVAKSSADWYRGWREHLEYAVIQKQGADTTALRGQSSAVGGGT